MLSGRGRQFPGRKSSRSETKETEDWLNTSNFCTSTSDTCVYCGARGKCGYSTWAAAKFLILPKRKLGHHALHAGCEKLSNWYQHIIARRLILRVLVKASLTDYIDWSSWSLSSSSYQILFALLNISSGITRMLGMTYFLAGLRQDIWLLGLI